MLKIETRIDPVEIDGAEVKGLPHEADQLIVADSRHSNSFVTLDWRGHSVTINADQLQRAIQNATNHR